MVTPNLGLILPTVGVTLGPTWASEINDAFETIDSHTHVDGQGARVPTAGLNINANLSFGNYSATALGSADLTAQGSALSTGSRRVFAYNGELYYRDASGNNVQITSGGVVNSAGSGAISGLTPGGGETPSATYTGATDQFAWFYDTGKQAKMQMADLLIFPYNSPTTYSNFVTLKASTSLSGNPTFTLPLDEPAADNVMSMSSSGVMSTGIVSGSASNPGAAFASDLDCGLYLAGTADVRMSIAGAEVARFVTGGVTIPASKVLSLPDGSAGSPSLTFSSDADTGLHWSTTNEFHLVTNGAAKLQVRPSSLSSEVVHLFTNGSSSAPGITFDDDTDLGLYRSADNVLGFAANGASIGTMSPSGWTVGTAGSAATPALKSTAAGDTGIFFTSTSVRFTASGSQCAVISAGDINVAAVNTGTGAVKFGRISLGSSSSTSPSFSVAHGLTISTIYSISISRFDTFSSVWASVTHTSSWGTVSYAQISGSNIEFAGSGFNGNSANYYALVVYA